MMKLQYALTDYVGLKTRIRTYQDGQLIRDYSIYDDEVNDEVDKLENEGYTFGYLPKVVNEAKREYEYKLSKMIDVG